ncbi:hypothetical protein ACWKWN_08690 [Microbacterium trichothecenolyticum]
MSTQERADRQRRADAEGKPGRLVDLGAVLRAHIEQLESQRGKPSPLDVLIPPAEEVVDEPDRAEVFSITWHYPMCSERCGWEGPDSLDSSEARSLADAHNLEAHGIPLPVPLGGWLGECPSCRWTVRSFTTPEAVGRGMTEHRLAEHSALIEFCAHDWSLTGAEGPVVELGRMPILWTCDVCGATVLDPEEVARA